MIYSFAFDPEAPGSKPRGHHHRSGINDTVAGFLRSGAGKPRFTRLSSISGSRNLSRCFDASLNGNWISRTVREWIASTLWKARSATRLARTHPRLAREIRRETRVALW